jgi:RHS repeat-associated protein
MGEPLGAIKTDVEFDFVGAANLLTTLSLLFDRVDADHADRDAGLQHTLANWSGRAAYVFPDRVRVGISDGATLGGFLRMATEQVRGLVRLAHEENDRRAAARAWITRRDHYRNHDSVWSSFKDAIGNDPDWEAIPEIGPLPPGPAPEPHEVAATAPPARETKSPSSASSLALVAGDSGASRVESRYLTQFRETVAKNQGAGAKGLPLAGSDLILCNPRELRGVATAWDVLDDRVRILVDECEGAAKAFATRTQWGSFDCTALLGDARNWIVQNRIDAAVLREVAAAFEKADHALGGALGPQGWFLWSNDKLDSALKEFVDRNPLANFRTGLSFTVPVLQGFVATSGFTHDPVNAATGDFFEPEIDLGFGPSLETLQFRRTYNSFDRSPGPFGPGWSSWASARLCLAADGRTVNWRGADGQEAVIPLADGTVPDTTGHVEAVAAEPGTGGLRLVMPQEGLVWHFDPQGRPVRLANGPGQDVHLTWEGDRLLNMRHERRRSMMFSWDRATSRITAVEAGDGRRVTYSYDDRGRLVRVTGPYGERRYEWDDRDRITAVVDADGVVEARNTYDVDRRVVTQVSPFGRTTRFWYRPGLVTEVDDAEHSAVNVWVHDTHARLERVTDGNGSEMTVVWGPYSKPLEVTDRRGGETRYRYDDLGRLRRTEHPDGTWEDQEWDEQHRLLAVTTPTGATHCVYQGTQREPAEVHDPEGGVTRYERSDDGRLLATTDPDRVLTSYEHDDEGRIVSVTDASGATWRYDWAPNGQVVAATSPLGHTTKYDRDAAGREVARIEPDGSIWRTEHSPAGRVVVTVDPLGHRHEIRYGPHGEPVARIDPLGHTVSFTYDALGNVTTTTDADGHVWARAHDPVLRPVSSTDPLGHQWRREYDPEGALSAAVAPSGRRLETPRDTVGRPLQLTATMASGLVPADDGSDIGSLPLRTFVELAFLGLPEDAELEVTYDRAGRVTALGRPDGSATTVDYDRCGRIVAVTQPSGAVTRFRYTAAGRLASATNPAHAETLYRYDSCGRLVSVVDPSGAHQRLRYDADGRLVEVFEATGERTRLAYDPCGRLIEVTGPDGATTRRSYDPCGRLATVTDPTGATVSFAYDPAGRLTDVTDPNGGRTARAYDRRGNLVSVTSPSGAETAHAYDPCGRLVTTTDPLGRATQLHHDPDGRLVAITYPDGTVQAVGPGSDAMSAGGGGASDVRIDALGRAAEVPASDGGCLLRRTWDLDGQLVTEMTPAATQRWERDAAGDVVAHTVERYGHEPVTVRYSLDPCGRVVAMDDPALGRVTIERDPAGRVTRVKGGGLDERQVWRRGRLVAWSRTVDRDASASVAVRFGHDAAGRITRARHDDGSTIRYCYDRVGQLVRVARGDVVWRFVWDADGRLVREHSPAGVRRYRYDRAGQLTETRDPAGVTIFAWDARGRRLQEMGPTGTCTYWWDDGAVDRLEATTWSPAGPEPHAGPVGCHLSYDGLGRLAAVDDAPVAWDATESIPRLTLVGDRRVAGLPFAGALVDGNSDGASMAEWLPAVDHRREPPGLDPWGAPQTSPPGGLAVGHRQELTVGGLVWLRARLYDPATRGFLSPDPLPPPIGAAWAHNPYGYAANDPVNAADPLGLQPIFDTEEIRQYFHKGWWSKHWKVVVGVGAVAGGLVLTVLPVTGPLGVALLLAGGALMGGGMSYAVQDGTTGHVSWKQVARDAVIGAVSAGASSFVGKALLLASTPSAELTGIAGTRIGQAGLRPLAGLGTTGKIAVIATSEGAINVIGGGVARYAQGQDVFDLSLSGIPLDMGVGAIPGAAGARWGLRHEIHAAAALKAAQAAPPARIDVDVPAMDVPAVRATASLALGSDPSPSDLRYADPVPAATATTKPRDLLPGSLESRTSAPAPSKPDRHAPAEVKSGETGPSPAWTGDSNATEIGPTTPTRTDGAIVSGAATDGLTTSQAHAGQRDPTRREPAVSPPVRRPHEGGDPAPTALSPATRSSTDVPSAVRHSDLTDGSATAAGTKEPPLRGAEPPESDLPPPGQAPRPGDDTSLVTSSDPHPDGSTRPAVHHLEPTGAHQTVDTDHAPSPTTDTTSTTQQPATPRPQRQPTPNTANEPPLPQPNPKTPDTPSELPAPKPEDVALKGDAQQPATDPPPPTVDPPTVHPLQGLWLSRVVVADPARAPFRSIMESPDAETARSLMRPVIFEGDYLAERARVEAWLQRAAEEQGVQMTTDPPIYFSLVSQPRTDVPDGMVVINIPAEAVPADVMSATVSDSFHAFALSKGRPDANTPGEATAQVIAGSDDAARELAEHPWVREPIKPGPGYTAATGRQVEVQVWARDISAFTHLSRRLARGIPEDRVITLPRDESPPALPRVRTTAAEEPLEVRPLSRGRDLAAELDHQQLADLGIQREPLGPPPPAGHRKPTVAQPAQPTAPATPRRLPGGGTGPGGGSDLPSGRPPRPGDDAPLGTNGDPNNPPMGSTPDRHGPWGDDRSRVQEWRETWWDSSRPRTTADGRPVTVPRRNPSVDHRPTGSPEKIKRNATRADELNIRVQNENARLMAENGFDVHRIKPGKLVDDQGRAVTADYMINGRSFEHKVAHGDSAQNFVDNRLESGAWHYRNEGTQADRFVVDLDHQRQLPRRFDAQTGRFTEPGHHQKVFTANDLRAELESRAQTMGTNVQEVFVVEDGRLRPLWPSHPHGPVGGPGPPADPPTIDPDSRASAATGNGHRPPDAGAGAQPDESPLAPPPRQLPAQPSLHPPTSPLLQSALVLPPPRWVLDPAMRGVRPADVFPQLYVEPSSADATLLANAVSVFGVERPDMWIDLINLEYQLNPKGPFGLNCVDASICFASTRQTGVSMAAKGYTLAAISPPQLQL